MHLHNQREPYSSRILPPFLGNQRCDDQRHSLHLLTPHLSSSHAGHTYCLCRSWQPCDGGFCPGIMWILENVELSPWPSTSCTPHSLAASCLSGGKDEAVSFSIVLITTGNHVSWTASFQPELVDWADQLMAFAVSILLWSNCHQSSLAFIPPASKKKLPADGLHSIQMLSAKHWKVLRPVAQTKPVNREPTNSVTKHRSWSW